MTDKTYNITVSIDHGELPSGNGRKTSIEAAKLIMEDVFGRHIRERIYDTSLISEPTFNYGDTTWVVSVECGASEATLESAEAHPKVEDIEECSIVSAEAEDAD